MALFWTSAGLSRLAQSESSGRADLIHYPSGYAPNGRPSSASGLYGYLDPTWRQYAGAAGVDTSVYPRAYMAPASVQTMVASQTPISHWTCPDCNSVASNMAGNPQYVSATPGTGAPVVDDPEYGSGRNSGTRLEVDPESGVVGPTSTDVTGTGVSSSGQAGGTGGTSGAGGAGGVGMGTPVTVGLQKGTIDNVTKWLNTNLTKGVIEPVQKFFGASQNWFQRALIMLVALVILTVALWKLAGEPPLPIPGAIGKLAKG